MRRVQVSFSDTEAEALRQISERKGLSLSAVVGYLTSEALALSAEPAPIRSGRPLRRSRNCGKRSPAALTAHERQG